MTVIRRKFKPAKLAWSSEDELIDLWRKWAEKMAEGIERGELPEREADRKRIAGIMRAAVKPPAPKKRFRGTPGRLPKDDRVAFEFVVMREWMTVSDALAAIAKRYHIADVSTVRKHLKTRLK